MIPEVSDMDDMMYSEPRMRGDDPIKYLEGVLKGW